jgi:hypothetical protein
MGRNTRQIKSRFTWHGDILVIVASLHSLDYWPYRVLTPYDLRKVS